MSRDAEAKDKILVVVAHPDDETFIFGGTIAKYSDKGFPIYLVILSSEHSDTKSKELKTAASNLGILDFFQLDHISSHINNQLNHGKNSVLSKTPISVIADDIEALIKNIKPKIVLSFDPIGVYGHPDHIVSSAATRVAIKNYSNLDNSVRLYEVSFARNMILIAGYFELLVKNLFPGFYKKPRYSLLIDQLRSLPSPTTVIDTSNWLKERQSAVYAHSSSLESGPWYLRMFEKIPHYVRGLLFNREKFCRIYPEESEFDDSTNFVDPNRS
jgi:LmbE family N-acetylglucosaminyl deacetylase